MTNGEVPATFVDGETEWIDPYFWHPGYVAALVTVGMPESTRAAYVLQVALQAFAYDFTDPGLPRFVTMQGEQEPTGPRIAGKIEVERSQARPKLNRAAGYRAELSVQSRRDRSEMFLGHGPSPSRAVEERG